MTRSQDSRAIRKRNQKPKPVKKKNLIAKHYNIASRQEKLQSVYGLFGLGYADTMS